jgi:hypothetical protein
MNRDHPAQPVLTPGYEAALADSPGSIWKHQVQYQERRSNEKPRERTPDTTPTCVDVIEGQEGRAYGECQATDVKTMATPTGENTPSPKDGERTPDEQQQAPESSPR